MLNRDQGNAAKHHDFFARVIGTPIAPMMAVVDRADRLIRLDFIEPSQTQLIDNVSSSWRGLRIGWEPAAAIALTQQISQYFDGCRRSFSVQFSPGIGSPFARLVWRALQDIPFGETTTYGGIAALIGNPAAARAVGRANAVNPISLVVPCHRVIAANDGLSGYSGGVHLKRALLDHERAVLDFNQSAHREGGVS